MGIESFRIPEPSQNPLGQKFREPWEHMASHFAREIRDSPDNIAAHISLADSLITLWCFGFVPREAVFPMAKWAAERAVGLDGNSALAHTTLGVVRMADWDWANAEGEFQRGIALDPLAGRACQWYGLFLAAMGRHEEALEQALRAVALDTSPGCRVGLGAALYFAHDFERLATEMEKAVSMAPDFAPAYDWLGMAYVQLGRFDESIRTYQRAAALSDRAAEILAGLGHAYGIAGRVDEAGRILDEMTTCAERYYVPPVQVAYVCIGLGDTNKAFSMLETAFAQRSWELVFIREEPWFDEQHGNHRFRNLIERMQFPRKP